MRATAQAHGHAAAAGGARGGHARRREPAPVNERVERAWALLPGYLGQHVSSVPRAGARLARECCRSWSSRSQRALSLAGARVREPHPDRAEPCAARVVLSAAARTVCARRSIFGPASPRSAFCRRCWRSTLYSMLPIVRNGVTGVLNIDPAVIEAARGVGMTEWQRLLRIELPLAMPVLMAGIRTAAVWVIGTATLSTPVGQTSLGNYIFRGCRSRIGCPCCLVASAAVLALVTDQLLGVIEKGVARRTGRVPPAPSCSWPASWRRRCRRAWRSHARYVIGAKSFTEQFILSELMAARSPRGRRDAKARGLGSAIVFSALASSDIDAYVDYSGTIWANVMGARTTRARGDARGDARRGSRASTASRCWGRWGSRTRTRSRCGAIARAARHATIADLARIRELAHRRRFRVLGAPGVGGAA